MILFEADDAGYESWIAHHPGGYVLNTTRPPSRDYLLMHLVGCYHISEHSGSSVSKWTGNEYMKVCASRRVDLEAWASDRFGRSPDRCLHCSP